MDFEYKTTSKKATTGSRSINQMTCEHPAVLFYSDDLWFKCEKCGKKLVKFNDVKDFYSFCNFIGKLPEKIMA